MNRIFRMTPHFTGKIDFFDTFREKRGPSGQKNFFVLDDK